MLIIGLAMFYFLSASKLTLFTFSNDLINSTGTSSVFKSTILPVTSYRDLNFPSSF